MIREKYLPQVNNFPFVSQNIAFNTEKNNSYTFPLEEIINLLSFLDADYEEYPGHVIMNFIILNEPYKYSNKP